MENESLTATAAILPKTALAAAAAAASPSLSDEDAEKFKFLQEHKGHEAQHHIMFLILMGTVIGMQIGIISWKRFYPSSYHWASTLGLLLVPPLIGLQAGNYTYLIVWLAFLVLNSLVLRRATENPLKSSTPGFVYKFYNMVNSICYAVGLCGYFLFVVILFKVPESLLGFSQDQAGSLFYVSIKFLFYGIYFGTLGRDFVERLSDVMATNLGYYSKKGFPAKHLRRDVCAICGESTASNDNHSPPSSNSNSYVSLSTSSSTASSSSTTTSSASTSSTPIKLDCKHSFHNGCIRGWVLIGKKDCCPYCKEKVDTTAFSRGSNPWDVTQKLYIDLLDAVRYLIVWNPILFFVVHNVYLFLGLS